MLLSSARGCGVQRKLFSTFSWKHNNLGKGKTVEEMCNLCTWVSSILTALWIFSSKTVPQNNCSVKKLPYNLSKYEFAKKIVVQLSQWVNNNADLKNEVQFNTKDWSFINQNSWLIKTRSFSLAARHRWWRSVFFQRLFQVFWSGKDLQRLIKNKKQS